MRSCLKSVRKLFGKKSPEQQLEAACLNDDKSQQQQQEGQEQQCTNVNYTIAETYNNQSQSSDKTLSYHAVFKSSDKASKQSRTKPTPMGLGKRQSMMTNQSDDMLMKDKQHLAVNEPTTAQQPNAYIEEYKSFMEEKQQLLSASTPYSRADSFDFEQLFSESSRRYSEAQTIRLLRHVVKDESEYSAKAAAESADVVTPLPSEQTRPLRPVTLPRCALPLEFTEALKKLNEKVQSGSESLVERALSQRHCRLRSNHKLIKQALERHLQLQAAESVKDNEEDEHEVVLRRQVQEFKKNTCSLFERRQPDCPKLRLSLNSTTSCAENTPRNKSSSDAEV